MSSLRALSLLIKARSRSFSQIQDYVSHRKYSTDPSPTEEIKGLVVGVYLQDKESQLKFTPSGEKADDMVEGKITELAKECQISGHVGKGKVFNNVGKEFSSIAVVGLGAEGASFNDLEVLDEGMENVRIAAGVGARALQLQGCTEVHVDGMEYPEQAAEGAALAVWRYNMNRLKADRTLTPRLALYDSSDTDAWTRGLFKAESQNLARRLSDTPANMMTPTIFAQAAVDALCPCGVTVEVRTMDWIEEKKLNSFLIIAKGSCEPPIVLEISYCGGSPDDKPVLLVGKGITFNSGGLCLREKCSLAEYRGSMCGAAVCVGAIRAAAALSLPLNVSAVIPLCENMPSGMACKPGDVVTLMNGKTLGVRSLDKAGTVIMADSLLYGQATFKPKLMIDVGCMAMGVRKGLGGSASGLFSNSNHLYKQFEKAGAITGDRIWRLPLWKYFSNLIQQNKTYDISNDGDGPASSCIAAAVLHQCVPCIDWAHLDIRGTGLVTKYGVQPYLLKCRMSGRPTRTIVQVLHQLSCPE